MSSPTVRAENPAREHLLPQDDSSSGLDTTKPRLLADDQRVPSSETLHEPSHQHYRLRALVAIFIPTVVTAYYGVIWVLLVQGTPIDEAVKYNTYSGSLIFYSWFIIGVFALSWSKFGLVGVEAAMLHRSRFWAAPDMVAMLMHSNGTWSGPSGWYAAVKGGRFYRLWTLLAVLSFLPFIAVPLSGLVFEISDGYIQTSDTPSVRGLNSSTFNERFDRHSIVSNSAENAWLIGFVPAIPGFGLIYTNESVDRSEHPDFEKLPNSLPLTESIPDLFLAPQAENPVSGTAWGMRIKYDCSVVKSVSEFTILSQKHESSIHDMACATNPGRSCISAWTPSGPVIQFRNTTNDDKRISANVEAYYEVASSGPQLGRLYHEGYPDYEPGEGNTSLVLEYAVWQYRVTDNPYNDLELPFNITVAPFIEDMGHPFIKGDNDTFYVNTTFFTTKGDLVQGVPGNGTSTNSSALVALRDPERNNTVKSRIVDVAPPIGVRCVASSGLGTADIDGVTTTFSNFQRLEPFVNQSTPFGLERFGYNAEAIVRAGEFYHHYFAGGLSGGQPWSNSHRYPQYLDGLSLLRSINLAYALDAFNLMYGITSGYKEEWLEPNLTSSREGKILSVASLIPGAAVGYLVLALFCIWAILSAGLAAWYGFRKRPADRVGGDVMLRKGADLAEEIRGDAEFMRGKSFYKSRTLTALRGS